MAFEELLQYLAVKVTQTNVANNEENQKSSSRELLDYQFQIKTQLGICLNAIFSKLTSIYLLFYKKYCHFT